MKRLPLKLTESKSKIDQIIGGARHDLEQILQISRDREIRRYVAEVQDALDEITKVLKTS